jgi:hypothetical protein
MQESLEHPSNIFSRTTGRGTIVQHNPAAITNPAPSSMSSSFPSVMPSVVTSTKLIMDTFSEAYDVYSPASNAQTSLMAFPTYEREDQSKSSSLHTATKGEVMLASGPAFVKIEKDESRSQAEHPNDTIEDSPMSPPLSDFASNPDTFAPTLDELALLRFRCKIFGQKQTGGDSIFPAQTGMPKNDSGEDHEVIKRFCNKMFGISELGTSGNPSTEPSTSPSEDSSPEPTIEPSTTPSGEPSSAPSFSPSEIRETLKELAEVEVAANVSEAGTKLETMTTSSSAPPATSIPSPTPDPDMKSAGSPTKEPTSYPTCSPKRVFSPVAPLVQEQTNSTTLPVGSPQQNSDVSTAVRVYNAWELSNSAGLTASTLRSSSHFHTLLKAYTDFVGEVIAQMTTSGNSVPEPTSRRLEVLFAKESTVIYSLLDTSCPASIETQTILCQKVFGLLDLHVNEENNTSSIYDAYVNASQLAIDDGRLQSKLEEIDPNSVLTVLGASQVPAETAKTQLQGDNPPEPLTPSGTERTASQHFGVGLIFTFALCATSVTIFVFWGTKTIIRIRHQTHKIMHDDTSLVSSVGKIFESGTKPTETENNTPSLYQNFHSISSFNLQSNSTQSECIIEEECSLVASASAEVLDAAPQVHTVFSSSSDAKETLHEDSVSVESDACGPPRNAGAEKLGGMTHVDNSFRTAETRSLSPSSEDLPANHLSPLSHIGRVTILEESYKAHQGSASEELHDPVSNSSASFSPSRMVIEPDAVQVDDAAHTHHKSIDSAHFESRHYSKQYRKRQGGQHATTQNLAMSSEDIRAPCAYQLSSMGHLLENSSYFQNRDATLELERDNNALDERSSLLKTTMEYDNIECSGAAGESKGNITNSTPVASQYYLGQDENNSVSTERHTNSKTRKLFPSSEASPQPCAGQFLDWSSLHNDKHTVNTSCITERHHENARIPISDQIQPGYSSTSTGRVVVPDSIHTDKAGAENVDGYSYDGRHEIECDTDDSHAREALLKSWCQRRSMMIQSSASYQSSVFELSSEGTEYDSSEDDTDDEQKVKWILQGDAWVRVIDLS